MQTIAAGEVFDQAGRRHVDVVVMRLEAVAERLRHLLLVLDDEDAHIERV